MTEKTNKQTYTYNNSSQVKNQYTLSQSFHSKCFSKDGNYPESQHFVWPFNYKMYIQNDSKITIH